MTPLAKKVLKSMRAGKHYSHLFNLKDIWSDLHFFDCRQINEAAKLIFDMDVKRKIEADERSQSYLQFLPADHVWLEVCDPEGVEEDSAIILWKSEEHENCANVANVSGRGTGSFFLGTMRLDDFNQWHYVGHLPTKMSKAELRRLIDDDKYRMTTPPSKPPSDLNVSFETQAFGTTARINDIDNIPAHLQALGGEIYSLLACINTPKVIGRRQRMPNAKLERRLMKQAGITGKYPLRAWTEIILEVGPPKEDKNGIVEGRLTGARALHFVRRFGRFRNGKFEIVSPHWRGDAAVGIKRSRYKAVPQKQGAN